MQEIVDAQYGVTYDYAFAGERNGEMVQLLLLTQVIDHLGQIYTRRSQYLLKRELVIDCIQSALKEHLLLVGVDPVQVRGLMRDFEFDKGKKVEFDVREFGK